MHKKNRFSGNVDTRWLAGKGKDREMLLLSNFVFFDSKGKKWEVDPGHIVDGASIPKVAWNSITGTPFIGDYRRATVLHDVECKLQREPSKAVHKMFLDAMLADGVKKWKAKMMYQLVAWFGPKW